MRDKSNRKDMATRVDADIKITFQEKCKEDNVTMSEALEALMMAYINEEFVLEKQTKYKAIKNKNIKI